MGRYPVSEGGNLLFDSEEIGRGKSTRVFDISAGVWIPAGRISAETCLNSRPISDEEAARILASESPKDEAGRVLSSIDAKTVFKLVSWPIGCSDEPSLVVS